MVEIVYILGSTRSGTSALRNGLNETRFSGYGEGHLAPIIIDAINAVRNHGASGIGAKVPGNGLNQLQPHVLIRHLVAGYERYLVRQLGSESLLDKTPTITPIAAAPDLNRFHQNPRFIHCSRRHIDNILSKQKKFPEQTLEQHCREWAGCNLKWREVRGLLNDNYLAFDFHDLASDPEGTAERIAGYLSLDASDTARLTSYLVNERPESRGDRDLTQFVKLDDTGWSETEKQTFLAICGTLGQQMGYGLDTYFA